MKIRTIKRQEKKEKPSPNSPLAFGHTFTDYMFQMDYRQGSWQDPRITPFEEISLSPAAMCLHYGQTVFEGLKAYRLGDRVTLFRPQENLRRLNQSCDRLCIPNLDEDLALEALKALVDLERDWIPQKEDGSLYIRPFIIPTDPNLGVHAGKDYSFFIVLSPSGSYYSGGLSPVSIYVEEDYVRAVKGGMGMAKTGGNYASSLKSQELAQAQGYDQTLWLDGVHRKYIEEVGAMNIFFVTDEGVMTPELNGSILAGVTRKSVIDLLRARGTRVEERKISMDDLVSLYDEGKLLEAFGTGTAAVISPIGKLTYRSKDLVFNEGNIGPLSQDLYTSLTNIQWGLEEGPEGWVIQV